MGRSSTLEVNLYGGLGNQMFIYAAGLLFANELDLDLTINLSSIDWKHTEGKHDLRTFLDLKSVPASFQPCRPVLNIKNKYLSGIVDLVPRVKNWRLRQNGWVIDDGKRDGTEIVRDIRKLGTKRAIAKYKTTGYFQDFWYAKELTRRGIDLKKVFSLEEKSHWFNEVSDKISLRQSIGLHIRLGDFENQNNKEKLGILSLDYYRRALTMITRQSDIQKVFVFTNNEESVLRLFPDVEILDLEIIEHPDGANPAESLLLLSQCDSIICGNSTFSFWAAMLSKSGTEVVFPKPFYRNDPHTISNLPTDWTPCKSEFI
jgi:hypothetical protein